MLLTLHYWKGRFTNLPCVSTRSDMYYNIYSIVCVDYWELKRGAACELNSSAALMLCQVELWTDIAVSTVIYSVVANLCCFKEDKEEGHLLPAQMFLAVKCVCSRLSWGVHSETQFVWTWPRQRQDSHFLWIDFGPFYSPALKISSDLYASVLW